MTPNITWVGREVKGWGLRPIITSGISGQNGVYSYNMNTLLFALSNQPDSPQLWRRVIEKNYISSSVDFLAAVKDTNSGFFEYDFGEGLPGMLWLEVFDKNQVKIGVDYLTAVKDTNSGLYVYGN